MPQYIFDDEDNEPMYYNLLDQDGHNPTVYNSIAEMKAMEREPLPFTDLEPGDGCWNCLLYDYKKEACTRDWNNLNESYYNQDLHDRKPDDFCEYWEEDNDADPEDWFGGENIGNSP